MTSNDIKAVLDSLYENRSATQLANDPLSFCHRFSDPADQEVAGLIASSFAYGNVNIILRTLDGIFAKTGDSPLGFVRQFEPEDGLKLFKGFKHRFNDSRDLCALFLAIRLMIEESGSINAYFLRQHDGDAVDLTASLNGFSASIKNLDLSSVYGQAEIPKDAYFPFFFPAPASGSACKRLCMYLRWMVRPSDGVDLGIWQGVRPSQLIIPVDTHIQRICRYLGFTIRKSADWRMACEITAALRLLDKLDPVKYDFSIAHLGISEGCDGKDRAVCSSCQISGICSQNSAIKA
jgi:uncharacterized protein (TIGR02757 family)